MLSEARIIEELDAVAQMLRKSPAARAQHAASQVMGIRLVVPNLRIQLERVTLLLDSTPCYAAHKALARLLKADPTLLKLPIVGFAPLP